MEWFVDSSLDGKALDCFFEYMEENRIEVHTMQIYRGGRQLIRLAQEPYSCTDSREVYSLSKMFTSTVVGVAVEQGLLRVQDRLVDIFGREGASEKMSHITVRHLLSMNTGHDRCVIPEMIVAEDSAEAFFGVEPVYEPGTHFTYNTGASCMLVSVIERVTGRDFFQYACENLFYPMEMTDISWRRCADGRCVGGAGLHVSSDDIVKLGKMYLNGGIYKGRRILSEAWIREASSCVSDNSGNGTPDWCSGYGYQLWRNSRGGYRGDGAFGQLLVILPERDLFVAVQALVSDMQKEMDGVFNLLESMDGAVGAGKVHSFAPLPGGGALPEIDRSYRLEANGMNFGSLWIKSGGDSVQLAFDDGQSIQTVRAKTGCWTRNQCDMRHVQPALGGHLPGELRERLIMAVSCMEEAGKIVLLVRFRTSPHMQRWVIAADEAGLRISFAEPEDGPEGWREEQALTGR
ncbi:serine hydrolase domain-containing protein [Acetatifactor aquisgranensis]|uniref:serine hydrolase domain-containing protein n=1 Tax=Acetatifactor aquisgranensis TaxID=2941233 RepID=UPI0020406F50|nr:serine hydrolase domain-containing protein [Acetatifactor aquisgranensis]MCI8542862.1 beta-lactamase family protein [Lachnospiraceae bacterium]